MSNNPRHLARKAYIEAQWAPFPDLKTECLLPSEILHWLRTSDTQNRWAGGRIVKIDAGEISLEFGGSRIQFFSPGGFLMDAKNPDIPIVESASVLGIGDIVSVELKRGAGKSQVQIHMDSDLNIESPGARVNSLEPFRVKLLVPCNHPMPQKSANLETLKKWNLFLSEVRAFFASRDFLEVRTPTLVPSPGLEPNLDPFKTQFEVGRKQRTLYLPTSPEFHLKKMLASGLPRIFEMKECFRNGEVSIHHQPEFLMLEWYRAFSNLKMIEEDVIALIQSLSETLTSQRTQVQKLTVAQLFRKFLDFELTPQTSALELQQLLKNQGLNSVANDSWDDLFFRLFLEKIEPHLGLEEPWLISDYPPSQAALARLNEAGWADRFEVYWKGLELCNAFHELNDPAEQRRRFQQNLDEKARLKKEPVPLDQEFLSALDYGLPPSGGIALGLERLFMTLFDLKTIDEVRMFPLTPEVLS